MHQMEDLMWDEQNYEYKIRPSLSKLEKPDGDDDRNILIKALQICRLTKTTQTLDSTEDVIHLK